MIEFNAENHIEEQEGYTLVSERTIRFDGEKGYSEIELVYKEDRTGVFYMVEYLDKGHNGQEYTSWPKEVQKKTKTIEYYE